MKRLLGISLAIAMLMSMLIAPGALALNYSGSQENEATFETLEETRVSSPSAVANLETNTGKTFVSHPVLDGYPRKHHLCLPFPRAVRRPRSRAP